MTTSFPEFLVEQGLDVPFALLAVSALVYLTLLAVAWLVLRRRVNTPGLGAAIVATAAVLVVALIGITLFEASALWFLSERQGVGYGVFFTSARAVFFALYAGFVLLAVGCGFMIARLRMDRAAVAAVGAGVAVIVYLGLTLPFVEFLNACYVGRSFLSDDVRC